MTFDLQTILVQDQTFHLFNHAQKVTQLLALEYVHLTISFVLYEDLRTCFLNVSSLGGSLTKVESMTVANFTRNLFRSIWHRFDFPFGSDSLDISFRLRSTESFYSRQITKLIGWLFQSFEHRVLPDTKERRSGITPS
jgi:hypothetical protein